MRTRSNLTNCLLIVAWSILASSSSFAQVVSDYAISGRVLDELSRGVAKVKVCAQLHMAPPKRGLLCNFSDPSGNFVVHVEGPGQYTIFPDKKDAGYQPQLVPFYRNPSLRPVEVILTDVVKTASVLVPLGPKNGALVGKAVDALTGKPIENIRFRLCQAANPGICWITSVKNATGQFSIAAAHVPFTLQISSDGYEDWWGLSGFDKNTPISVSSGGKTELRCLLNRRPDAANRPLNEAEKFPFVNLAAPMQLSPADRVELDYYPRLTKLEWQPVDGAVSYVVEIDYCSGLDRNVRECVDPQPLANIAGILSTSHEFKFVGGQPGRWRVWAIDKNGQEGFKSPWRIFFYLR